MSINILEKWENLIWFILIFRSFLSIQIEPFVVMNVKVEPDMSFGVHVVGDEAYLAFSFV